jgi:hypothetical protein
MGVAQADEVCIDAPYLTAESDQQGELIEIYREMRPVVERFPSLLEALENMSSSLCLSDQMNNALAYLDYDKNQIVVEQALPRAMKIGVLLHELRHLWQFSRGSCPSDDLAMKEYAYATFAIEADASAISLLVAWDIKEHGDDSVWEALSSWPLQRDIASSFAKIMHETGQVGLAATSAFYQWYASDYRQEIYYASACMDYLDRQEASHIIPRYNVLDPGFFERLCRLPDGSAYHCSNPR